MPSGLFAHTVSTPSSPLRGEDGCKMFEGAGGRVGREKAVEGAWLNEEEVGSRGGRGEGAAGAIRGLGAARGGAGGCRIDGAGVIGEKVRVEAV